MKPINISINVCFLGLIIAADQVSSDSRDRWCGFHEVNYLRLRGAKLWGHATDALHAGESTPGSKERTAWFKEPGLPKRLLLRALYSC